MPGEIDRYNMRRRGQHDRQHRGRATWAAWPAQVSTGDRGGRRAAARACTVDVRGQVDADAARCSAAWRIGLVVAVVVIFLLLTAYFQSLRLALTAVAAVPGGAVRASRWRCWLTGTTLNIQSFMGAIMAVGVAVANAILLVTFAERARRRRASRRRGRR